MTITFYRHPNLIKVVNSYLIIAYGLSIFFIGFSIFSILTFFILLFILQKWTSSLISKKIVINISTISDINFNSYFIANAYGIGRLNIDKSTYYGIHVHDFEKLRGLHG